MPGPLPGAEAPFGRSLPHDRSRSALAVSHHLDGLLHRHGCGHVAARCQQGFTSTGEPPTGEPADDAPASAHTPQNTNSTAGLASALRDRALTRIDNVVPRERGSLLPAAVSSDTGGCFRPAASPPASETPEGVPSAGDFATGLHNRGAALDGHSEVQRSFQEVNLPAHVRGVAGSSAEAELRHRTPVRTRDRSTGRRSNPEGSPHHRHRKDDSLDEPLPASTEAPESLSRVQAVTPPAAAVACRGNGREGL
jgi:hypothetical protein